MLHSFPPRPSITALATSFATATVTTAAITATFATTPIATTLAPNSIAPADAPAAADAVAVAAPTVTTAIPSFQRGNAGLRAQSPGIARWHALPVARKWLGRQATRGHEPLLDWSVDQANSISQLVGGAVALQHQ